MATSTITPPRKTNALDVFVSQEKVAKIWFLLFLAVLGVSIWDRQRLVDRLTTKPLFFAVDSAQTFYISSLADFESAKNVHDVITRMAAECLYNRNPKGSDAPERMRLLFFGKASDDAKAMIGKEEPLFTQENIHQKIELGPAVILQTSQDKVITSIKGQVIRTGVLNRVPYTDVFQAEINFKMVLNKDMRSNGRYPVVVYDFEPHLTKVAP